MEELNQLKYFFFDLDKTLWNWDDTIIGAEDLIDSLKQSERQVFFHTDNTLLTRQEYARKLTSIGINAEKDQILTSGYVAAKHLAERNINNVYTLGESGLMDELEAQDIQVTEDSKTVVAGFDRQFNYNKLKRAAKILQNGGELLVCSNEKSFRTSKGEQPHQGPTNKALEQFSEAKLLGKPSPEFRNEFKSYFDYIVGKSAFIGDRLEDIETGNRLGMTTIAVMSGEITEEKLKEADEMQKPEYGLSSLHKLRRRVL